MSDFKFPDHYVFLGAIDLTEEERYYKGYDLQKLYFDSKKEWKERLELCHPDNRKEIALDCIELMELAFDKVSLQKTIERKLLLSFIDYLYEITPELEDRTSSFEEDSVFKNREGLEFYIETLQILNVIDDLNKKKYGFQAGANAIFRNLDFKKNVFVFNLQLRDYIGFLNKVFSAEIQSKSKLSDGGKYENKVKSYYKQNNQFG